VSPTWKYLSLLFKERSVVVALAEATLEHRRMERDFRRRLLRAAACRADMEFPHLALPALQYLQRNFFSILFLSIYGAVGISKERRQHYALITHALRGLVTCSDNILDGEDKGAVRLRLGGGPVLPDILLILMQDGLLHESVARLTPDLALQRRTCRALTDALVAIAREECTEEGAVEDALPPVEVLDSIHRFRGEQLLQLAFVAPQVNEPQLVAGIGKARRAVGRLGMALQVLDDVTDFAEDVSRRNHNVLRSWVVHEGPDGPVSDPELAALGADRLSSPEQSFPRATRQVLSLAVAMALEGFGLLHETGHAVDREAGLRLLEMMFHLRGLDGLWALCEAPDGSRLSA
jgi:hypothetical protein